MTLKTLRKYLRDGKLRVLMQVIRKLVQPSYRAFFVAASYREGLLASLATGPKSFDQLATEFCPHSSMRDAFASWLDIGVYLGELSFDASGFQLCGSISRGLSNPVHDDVAAFLQELLTVNHMYFLEALPRIRQGHRFPLESEDTGCLIARASRVVEPLVQEAIDAVIPTDKPMRLLEIGCGTAAHIRYAAQRNPHLTAVGLELHPEVAAMAKRNLNDWGLAQRVSIVNVDARHWHNEEKFDLLTLHNNIYYCSEDQRNSYLIDLKAFLKPEGRLLLTTGCRGGRSLNVDLWGALTDGCSRLPDAAELELQLTRAGFELVATKNLLPSDSFRYFLARNDSRPAI